jgi:ubiquinol-cytochrome c reductase cytochrome b/c1 subunit
MISIKRSLLAIAAFGALTLPVLAQDNVPAPAGGAAAPAAQQAAPPAAQGTVEQAPQPATGPAVQRPSPAQLPSAAAPAPSTEALPPKSMSWSFDGPFGVYDRASLQRGFQVYKEVCSACHSLSRVAIRNLADAGGPGFSEQEVAAIAAMYKVPAEPNEQGKTTDDAGQPLTRAAVPSDYFPPPFPNEKAARAAMNGALPPDLSLIVKNREGHSDYVYSILTGFGQKPPPNEKMARGMNYNPYFPRHQIAMPPPLTMGSVTYADGTPSTVDQEAHDVVTFLTWASEPKMEERKRMGFNVILYLIGLTVLLYFTYHRVWHGRHDVGATGEGGH